MNFTFAVHPKVDFVQSEVFTKINEAANVKLTKPASLKKRFISGVFGGVNCAREWHIIVNDKLPLIIRQLNHNEEVC